MKKLDTKLDMVVNLIVNQMNKDIQEEEKRHNFKFERTNMQDYLDEIRWGMTSKEFKEEVYYLANKQDNERYNNGYINARSYINMMDDGSIEEFDGTIITYRQIMARVRKEVFKNNEEED